MNAPVDVLHVIEECAKHTFEGRASALREARAAVAELIEAADNALAKRHSHDPARPEAAACMVRLRAALARCKGEQP
jgi:hypothetical protein